MLDPVPALVGRLIVRSLKQNFRRIGLVDPPFEVPPNKPLILYANHHNFFDGYVLWYLVARYLNRPVMTWMADWDRFPLFAALGALPFPLDDTRRRLSTIRRTQERFSNDPLNVLFYFPEGQLHPPEEGIHTFDNTYFGRFDRIFPDKLWIPVAIHITYWGEAQPTCLIKAGAPHALSTGDEPDRLRNVWNELRDTVPDSVDILLEGKKSPQEKTSLSLTRGFFSRYL